MVINLSWMSISYLIGIRRVFLAAFLFSVVIQDSLNFNQFNDFWTKCTKGHTFAMVNMFTIDCGYGYINIRYSIEWIPMIYILTTVELVLDYQSVYKILKELWGTSANVRSHDFLLSLYIQSRCKSVFCLSFRHETMILTIISLRNW